ncbi:MAG: thiamine phosphate synthase [Bacteroidales bacterium]
MNLIIITTDKTYPQEATVINQLFEAGLGTLNLRKPSWSKEETIAFLNTIDEKYYSRIVLHDHYDLTDEYIVKGIHLNSRNSDEVLYSDCFKISDTLRSIDELENTESEYRFHFLSPVYDSISKEGYKSAFSKKELQKACDKGWIRRNTIALGGVTEDKLEELDSLGFGGVAMLGDFWSEWEKDSDNDKLVAKYRRIQDKCNQIKRRNIPRLHGIALSDAKDPETMLMTSLALVLCGLPLFQFRNKHIEYPLNVPLADMLQQTCSGEGVVQIINDNPLVAIEVNADGVHLGKKDMPVKEARELLGYNYIIGGTANTMDDIRQLVADGVDYIGLGPFRFTKTKENLSPVIGLEGYQRILSLCREEGITIPVIAIGGITIDDIPAIMATGVHGVAMSGGLKLPDNKSAQDEDTENHIENILKTIYENAKA